jgi:hypothetical protein
MRSLKYQYEDLSSGQFEDLVIGICHHLLGASVEPFADGADGGRDARFEGTAAQIPNKEHPWTGVTIVQAKHTSAINQYFSDKKFFSDSSDATILGPELPKIKALREAKGLDNYILFANRNLTANTAETLRLAISTATRLPTSSILLAGHEKLEMWLKLYPEIADSVQLESVDGPLIVSPQDLAVVIEAIADKRDEIAELLDDPPVERTSYERKNELNGMSEEYAATLRAKYLKEEPTIRAFLAAPENEEFLKLYKSTVDEFQLKVVAHRKEYQSFDLVMNHLQDLLFGRDYVLRTNKALTRAVLFFMYWTCDIGKTEADA